MPLYTVILERDFDTSLKHDLILHFNEEGTRRPLRLSYWERRVREAAESGLEDAQRMVKSCVEDGGLQWPIVVEESGVTPGVQDFRHYGSRPKRHDHPPKRGWAPGLYVCYCRSCEIRYIGDKRSTVCYPCAESGRDAFQVSVPVSNSITSTTLPTPETISSPAPKPVQDQLNELKETVRRLEEEVRNLKQEKERLDEANLHLQKKLDRLETRD